LADLEEETLLLLDVRRLLRQTQIEADEVVPSGRPAVEIDERADGGPVLGLQRQHLLVDFAGTGVLAAMELLGEPQLEEQRDLEVDDVEPVDDVAQQLGECVESTRLLGEATQRLSIFFVIRLYVQDAPARLERRAGIAEPGLLKPCDLAEHLDTFHRVFAQVGLPDLEDANESGIVSLRAVHGLEDCTDCGSLDADARSGFVGFEEGLERPAGRRVAGRSSRIPA
jgi:hypothetical protein